MLAIGVTTLYAASDELHQLFVPGRDSSVFDWTADAIGGAAGAALFAIVTAKKGRTPFCEIRKKAYGPFSAS